MSKLTFYFDRNVGKRFPFALSNLRPPVEIRWHQKEGFPQDMDDDAWLSQVGPKGWIVLSQDHHFHVRDAEIEAVRQHSIKCFYLPGADQTTWVLNQRFSRSIDKLIRIAETVPGPFVFELLRNGKIKQIPL